MDQFATNVQQLVTRHQDRLPPEMIARIALQRWLILRTRYSDPFDPKLFGRIDDYLATVTLPGGARPVFAANGGTETTPPSRVRQRGGRSVIDRPVSRFR